MLVLHSSRLPTPLHRWASLRSELLWVYDGPVAAESRHTVSDHRHGYWVWLLRRGEVKIEVDGRMWRARPGEWMVSPHGVTVQDFSDDARILSMHFRCQWPTGEDLFGGSDGMVFPAKKYPRLERSAEALQRLAHRHFPGIRLELVQQGTGFPIFLRLQMRFQQWLIDFFEAMVGEGQVLAREGDYDERLLRAAQCLHEASLEEPFPAAQLQRETGLGRAHLDRLFWKAFGATTRDYWDRLREESATRSLVNSSLSIKEIGYRLGFKQASHFTKWFLRRVGTTPTAYRAKPVEA